MKNLKENWATILVVAIAIILVLFILINTTMVSYTYTVEPGDGWYAIARKTECDVNEILNLNDKTIDDPLYVGQEIKLPHGTTYHPQAAHHQLYSTTDLVFSTSAPNIRSITI